MALLRSVLVILSLSTVECLRMLPLRNAQPEMKAAVTGGSIGWLNVAAHALKDEAEALARVTARVARLLKKRKSASVAVSRLESLTVSRTYTEDLFYTWEPTPMPFIIDQDLSFEWGEAGDDEDEEDEIFY